MTKPKIVIGNWKMNKDFEEAEDLITQIEEQLADFQLQTEVVLCPPAVYAELVTDHADIDENHFYAGLQNVSEFENGAYTGEISAEMMASMNVDFCIVGHSERRKYFGETDEVVQKQIESTVCTLTADELERVMIAYEPIWAIGTGETATPAQAQEMLAFIRSLIEKKFGTELAVFTYILYGGSCNAKNALELFSQPDVDGGLIGGASLKPDEFVKIIEAAETVIKDN